MCSECTNFVIFSFFWGEGSGGGVEEAVLFPVFYFLFLFVGLFLPHIIGIFDWTLSYLLVLPPSTDYVHCSLCHKV